MTTNESQVTEHDEAAEPSTTTEPARREHRKAVVSRLWELLYVHDFDGVGAMFTPDGHYTDVPSPDDGARGPEAIAARLKLGLEPIEPGQHELHAMVCEGSLVITEHTETWIWHTGESVALPFVSVMELDEDDMITRWWDYWDLQTLMNSAPDWWIERIMSGAEEIGLA